MIKGDKAIVTGGSRGIGFAIAEQLAKNGCSVVITGRNIETLQQAVEKIGGKVYPLVWDVSQIELAEEKVREATKILGGLDIVVNNAGIFAQNKEWLKEGLLNTTVNQWETVIRTNTSSVFFIMQAAVKYMIQNGIKGNICNISSAGAYKAVRGSYGASKIAVIGLTKAWGRIFVDDGITINGIAPGPVATEMSKWYEGDSMKNDNIPFGRYVSAEEVAKLCMYLLSEEAEMVCGETVVLDGAYSVQQ